MKEKVTINHIAGKSGYSLATVSLALNNKPGVSEGTRTRIIEIANELGYQIKPPASQTPNNNLTTVGMLLKTDPDILPQANPFYSKVMMGIEDACHRNGINLLFATLPADENNRPLEVPQLLSTNMVEGLLMVGMCIDENITSVASKNGVPLVLVDGYSTNESIDSVISDNFRAAYSAVEYLLQNGHRHIGLVGSGSVCYPSLRDRRNGYLRALKENGINETYLADFNIKRTHGYQDTAALLSQYPQITALFCVNDDVASAALKAAQDSGKRVPKDLSIIGFDDTYIAANAHPALTTLHVDTLAMGRAAVHLLSLRMSHPDSARMTVTIHPELVERQSVRNISNQS
jgi:LacI family transcriptional regulator